MRSVACVLLVVAACNTGNQGDDYAIEPGGGGGSFGNTPGAFTDAAVTDGGGTLMARVCGLSEILFWDECDAIGLDGLMVTAGSSQATTRDSGAFEIANPTGSNLVWRVSGNAQLPSLMELAGNASIPSLRRSTYQDLAATLNVNINPQAGTIFVQVRSAGDPVVGATATLAGLTDLVRYDDANATGKFNVDATHADGIIWFPNVAPGTVTFTITPPAQIGAPKMTTLTVEADTATFALVGL